MIIVFKLIALVLVILNIGCAVWNFTSSAWEYSVYIGCLNVFAAFYVGTILFD